MKRYTRCGVLVLLCAISLSRSTAQASYDDLVDSATHSLDRGAKDAAIDLCNKAIRLDAKRKEAFFVRGWSKFTTKEYDNAIADLSHALELDPTFDECYFYRGQAKFFKGSYDAAIVDFDQAIRFDLEKQGAFYFRGLANYNLARYDQAIPDFNRCLQLNPRNADDILNLNAFAKYSVGLYKEAIADLDQSIGLNPKNRDAYMNRGSVKSRLRQYPEAIVDFNQCLKLDPTSESAYKNLGYALIETRDYSAAANRFGNAIRLKPDDPAAYNGRGYCYFNLKQYAAAIADYDKAAGIGGAGYSPYYSYRKEAGDAAKAQSGDSPSVTTNPFINLSWISPADDSRNLIYKLSESNHVELHLRVVSSVPLTMENFTLLINGRSGGKATLADLRPAKVQDGYEFDFRQGVDLLHGKTTIQLVADIGGYKKQSPPLTVEYAPQEANLYLLSIGIKSNLKYSVKDAEDFAAIFAGQAGEGKLFRKVEIKKLLGADATALSILNYMDTLTDRKPGHNDVLMIFISSHGYLDDGKLLLLASDFNPERKIKTSVNFKEEILDRLMSLDCKKFIFLDACHSGNATEGAKEVSTAAVSTAITQLIQANNGISILASSSADQSSWEDDEWQNGAFTYIIKQATKDGLADTNSNGIIRMDELVKYVRENVEKLVKEKKKAVQTPTGVNSIGNVAVFLK